MYYQGNGFLPSFPHYFQQPIYNNYMNYPTYSHYPFGYFQPVEVITNVLQIKDYGPQPFVININEASKQNNNFRTALWTGKHLQVTLMSIEVGDDIGLEIHPHLDQFLRIEQGHGIVQMGKSKNDLDFVQAVADDSAIMIPAGTWHNVKNTGTTPLKMYSIYAPTQHPFGTIHVTKEDAMAAEH